MILTANQMRLFDFLIRFYIKEQSRFYTCLDNLWSSVFWMEGNLIRTEWNDGTIDTEKRDRGWADIDQEIADWEERLSQWRLKKWRLEQLQYKIQKNIREVYRANAA